MHSYMPIPFGHPPTSPVLKHGSGPGPGHLECDVFQGVS